MKLKILILSPIATHPKCEGNSERVFQVASALREAGFDLFLFHIRISAFGGEPDFPELKKFWKDNVYYIEQKFPYKWTGVRPSVRSAVSKRVARWRRKLGIQHPFCNHLENFVRGKDAWLPCNVEKAFRKVVEEWMPDVVLAEYFVYSKLLKLLPNGTRRVIDTHDCFTNRFLTTKGLGGDDWISLTRSQERKALLRADALIAIQSEELAYFDKLTRSQRPVYGVELLSHVVHLARPSCCKKTLGYIASPNPLNLEAIRWFLDQIWEDVRQAAPQATLLIAGSICDHLRGQPGVKLLGRIGERADFYAQCRAMINPMQRGTGLKIKSVEALLHGRPLVATVAGATGLDESSKSAIWRADSAREFQQGCIEFLKNDALADQASLDAMSFCKSLRSTSLHNLFEALGIHSQPVRVH